MKSFITIVKKVLIVALCLILILAVVILIYLQQPQFGKSPTGERLERIKKSPAFKEGKFQNQRVTPQISEGYSIWEVTYEFLFKRDPRRTPLESIPSIKTDLKSLQADVLVWFGHSSYYIQLNGKHILVDPVFSGNASPIPGTNTSFKGTEQYTTEDLPTIDYLFISHDHYDHLDYKTILKLQPKVKKVICGLGVGEHLESWGYTKVQLIEKDWYETIELDKGFTVFTTPARHFSGRGFSSCNTLWMSFVLQTPTFKLFIGGDSGYDIHFKEIGDKFGPFDLAILENGQYDIKWKYIHLLPPEVLQAANDLQAKRLFPVHSSKFVLANHAWDEPLRKITELNQNFQIPLVTPLIGETVHLLNEHQVFTRWWEGVK